ncbi:uncharacterized protein N7473_005381 [Penicillium subrubescens]|uniref:uncharacterized protein n=1 Tax=Penicillium subrubescens TaxID=1316194 RepID=UPI002545042D|nr:uncharacterized protein N7473_005381 [Penicillium subrubescens]KAJ5895982.1 hypothetical protein N7473_005381 [Penicillium subrubescens]
MMNPSARRKRLACAECTRRKIKCDKVLPCRNCRHRGSACYRSPHDSAYLRATGGSSQLPQRSGSRSTKLTGTLAACLNELQATLQAVRTPDSSSPNLNDRAVSLSGVPEGISAQSPSEVEEASPSRETAEVEDAATILEFLAWGRRKVPGYDGLLGDPTYAPAQSPGNVSLQGGPADPPPQLRFTDDASSLPLLQLLLPEPLTLLRMVKYHCECLLWYHASFHGRVFQGEVDRFFKQHHGRIDNQQVDLQWAALLFAVLAGSLICAPRSISTSWGFQDPERTNLAHRLFKAALVCLNLADFTAHHSLYGVECIATMTISAHLLGHSNSHSVNLASAVRIAQSLESYLIHRQDFNTGKPQNCMDDDGMTAIPGNIPTLLTYHRFLYDIAIIMPQLQDDLSASQTLYTKYEHVIRYDTKLRTLVSDHIPSCLRNTTLESSWPSYVPWARHCLTISSAHKVIMIHRKFLWSSFTNPAFTFTRKTCIAAAKTIIREQKQLVREDGPVLWIYHAFSVAASIFSSFHSPIVTNERIAS